ncbi:MAG: SBBP repeat-containing protein, partial [Myxococcota bacterium]
GNHLWSKRFGGSSGDVGYSVSVDKNGNVYITGYFNSSSIDFGGGALTNAGGNCGNYPCDDIFLAKFDTNGNHLWSKRFGGNNGEDGSSVSVDSNGNVYITGWFHSSSIDFGGGALTNAGDADIFLAKFDTNGNHLWSKRFGGSDGDGGSSVSVDKNGNVYITGGFWSSSIDFGGGALTNANAGIDDIFLAKFDSNGNYLWSN